jgi:hypothetical protein
MTTVDTPPLAVAATFTARPIAATTRFWLDTIGLPHTPVTFAPAGHVVQQVLAPDPTTARFVLIRWEDWLPRDASRPHTAVLLLEPMVAELHTALQAGAWRPAPAVVVVFPPSPTYSTPQWTDVLARFDDELRESCAAAAAEFVHIAHEVHPYPVAAVDDPWSDRLGRIPYTDDYFTAAATVLCRRLWNVLHNSVETVVADAALLWRDGAEHPVAAALRRQSALGRHVVLWTPHPADEIRRRVEETPELGLRWRRVARCHAGADLADLVVDLVAAGDLRPERTAVLCADDPAATRVRERVPDLFAVAALSDAAAHVLDHAWFLDPGGNPANLSTRPRVFDGIADWSRDVPSIRARVATQEVA